MVWIVGRIVYMIGYSRAVAQRSPGFFIQALACGVLLLGSLGTILWRLMQG
jgi:glutathione S-transferase